VTRAEHTITFREREFKGSRLRCLLVTSQEATEIANFFTPLVAPHAVVTSNDTWAHTYPTEPGFIAALHSAFRIFATEISATLSDDTVLGLRHDRRARSRRR
jgi:hypothetical protein